MIRHCRVTAVMVLALAVAAPALAEQPLWELGLGAAALSLPHYRGSDQSYRWLLPVPFGVYRGQIFRATRDGARAVLLESDRFDFDISLAASPPTRSSDNLARSGMPDLAATVEVGPNLNLTLAQGADWKLQLRLPVRGVVTLGSGAGLIGWTASPALNLDLELQGWNLGLQGGPLAASRANHAYYYDVAPAYATAYRPAYSAPGGARRLARHGRGVAPFRQALGGRLRARRQPLGRGLRRQPTGAPAREFLLWTGLELGAHGFRHASPR